MSLISRSGGLFYHYLGFKYSSRNWADSRSFINQHLNDFINQTQRKILFIGPSAGYLFEVENKDKLNSSTFIDIDPLASLLFKIRHQSQGHWIRQDAFFSLNDLVSNYASHAFIFCNVLGQLPFIFPNEWNNDEKLITWKKSFRDTMKSKSVFSFHDRLTIVTNDRVLLKEQANQYLSTRTLVESLVTNSSTVIDHSTDNLFETNQAHYTLWPMTPNEHHVLECISQNPG